FVAADGVGVDRSGWRGDRDLELPEGRRSVELVGEAAQLLDRGLRVLEILEEAVPTLAALDRAPEPGRRHAAGEDRRSSGLVRPRSGLDPAERGEGAAQLRLFVVPDRAQGVDPLVGP